MPISEEIENIAGVVLGELDNTYVNVKDKLETGYGRCDKELSARLKSPFIGFAQTSNGDLYLCYGYTPWHQPKNGGAFVSYYAPIGKVFSLAPNGILTYNNKNWKLLVKHEFEPVFKNKKWDGICNTIVDCNGTQKLQSLVGFLENSRQDIKTYGFTQYLESLRREKVSLTGKYVLNAVQDDVMRSAISDAIILEGLPGSGKTTTIIKLIAKQCYYDENGTWLNPNKSWRLYVPTEILKDYVKEALNKESIPATAETIITWDEDERLFFARDIFKFLKVGERGVFRVVAENIDSAVDSDVSSLTEKMLKEVFKEVAGELKLNASDETSIVSGYLNTIREYSSLLTERDILIRDISSNYNWEFLQIKERVDILKNVGPDIIEESLFEFASLPQKSLHELIVAYNACRWIIEQKDDLNKKGIGDGIQVGKSELEKLSEEEKRRKGILRILLTQLFKDGVLEVITILAENSGLPTNDSFIYRLKNIKEKLECFPKYVKKHHDGPEYLVSIFIEQVQKFKKGSEKILPWEADAIIYGLLKLVTPFLASYEGPLLDSVRARIVEKIVIDEASDFSSIQVKIIQMLSRQGLVLSGDLMQRATAYGLVDWTECGAQFKKYPLNVVYRQNPRLLGIAKEIHKISTGTELAFLSSYPTEGVEYPAPLLLEEKDEVTSIRWICDDIVRLYNEEGRVAPTAIFVRSKAEIDSFGALLEPILKENAITLERCYEGRMSQSTRIGLFEYRHIKGLEFETAFLVYPDLIGESMMGKHIYIGATRATRYLRIVCKEFPKKYAGALKLFQR